MQLTFSVTIHDDEIRTLGDNSVERVFNTSIRLVRKTDDEDTWINLENLQACKPLAARIWDAARNELFKQQLAAQKIRTFGDPSP